MLPSLAAELGPESLDVVFLDAIKTEYADYFRLARPLVRPGGLVLADNVLGGGTWWIEDEGEPSRDGADRLNRLVAGDEDFEAVAAPIRQGLLIARRKGPAASAGRS